VYNDVWDRAAAGNMSHEFGNIGGRLRAAVGKQQDG
jgi:hypothetical protein